MSFKLYNKISLENFEIRLTIRIGKLFNKNTIIRSIAEKKINRFVREQFEILPLLKYISKNKRRRFFFFRTVL